MILGRVTAGRLPESPKAAWATVAILIVAVLGAIGVIFQEESTGALRVWIGSRTYNHCFLILPIALFMLWTRRTRLQSAGFRMEPIAVVGVALVSILWSATKTIGLLEAQQLAVLSIAQLVLAGALGRHLYHAVAAPLLYLYFLVPFGDFLTVPLMDFTSTFVLGGLHLFGIPVYANGAIIEVRSGVFAIEEACAGLRFLIATIALGVFYACQAYRRTYKRLVFVGFCLIVPIIANGLRALGIIVLSELFDNATAIETDHITYGFVFFSMVLTLLIFVGRLFADSEEGARPVTVSLAHWKPRTGLALGANAAVVFLGVVFGFASLTFLQRASAATIPEAPPRIAASWRPAKPAGPYWKPTIYGAMRSYMDARTDGSDIVYSYVGIYPPVGPASKMVRAQNRVFDEKAWQYSAHTAASLVIQKKRAEVGATIIVSGTRKRLAVMFYAVNGQVTSSRAKAKFEQFAARFSNRPCVSGLFVLATDFEEGAQAVAVLQRYVNAMQPPRNYLCRKKKV
jgi:exosortase A